MKGFSVKLVTTLFFLIMSAVFALTTHALTISGEDVGVLGNVNADSFSGSGAGLTDLSGANITGTVSESVIDPLICRDSELNSHTSDISLHHSRYTNAEAVAAIKAANGSGTGLDADFLDGQDASAFASATHEHDSGIFFSKVNGPGFYFADNTDPFDEVSWDSGISIAVTGPANIIVDFGGRASCESSQDLTSRIEVFPTIDGEQVGVDKAFLSTRSIIAASFSEPGRLTLTSGPHTLGLSAKGQVFNASSTGCYLYFAWIKAVYE